MQSIKEKVVALFMGKDSVRPSMYAQMVRFLAPMIDEYADWYAEHGMFLPEDLAADPTTWTQNLRKMQRALNLLEEELDGEGDLWDAEHGTDEAKVKELNDEISEGLTLFGKYLLDLRGENYEA